MVDIPLVFHFPTRPQVNASTSCLVNEDVGSSMISNLNIASQKPGILPQAVDQQWIFHSQGASRGRCTTYPRLRFFSAILIKFFPIYYFFDDFATK